MNVKCPYCNCQYEIDNNMLQKPIGNEHLGYGWWLRCYKCHKKWWLKNSEVELKVNTPLRADRQSKINRLSAFAKANKKRGIPKKHNTRSILKYLILVIVVTILYSFYQNREMFNNYLISKARYISQSVVKRIVMTDVKYAMEDNKLSVTGNIVNEDKIIAQITGVKIAVFDRNSEVFSWNAELETNSILPEQKISFSSTRPCPKEIKNIRVEVSVF